MEKRKTRDERRMMKLLILKVYLGTGIRPWNPNLSFYFIRNKQKRPFKNYQFLFEILERISE
jgi:hypothetical protein